jgi:hypothetical protein
MNVTLALEYTDPEVYAGAFDLGSTSGSDESCANWTVATSAAHARTGFSAYILPTGFGEASDACTLPDARVYCLEAP